MATVTGLLAGIAGFIKVRLRDKVSIDSASFRLHYRFTSACFFAACILITAFDLIGKPIDCVIDDFPRLDALNTYCWIASTFTLPEHYDKKSGDETAYHGVGTNSKGERIFHSYYQWVPFVLFLQGILFYLPHWLWKQSECGRMKTLTEGLRGTFLQSAEDRKSKASTLIAYFQQTLHMNKKYAYAYVGCEFLNFLNVIGNIFFINRFLGGAFLTFGSEVLRFTDWDQENRTDPIIKIFPRLTKCTFNKYGVSGTIESRDALCVLALNVLNEKIYILLWFWLITLAVISGLALVYRAAIIFSPLARAYLFQRRSKISSVAVVETLVRRTEFGDFFVLHLLGRNMHSALYNQVLLDLGKEFGVGGVDTRESSVSKDPGSLEMAPILTKFNAASN